MTMLTTTTIPSTLALPFSDEPPGLQAAGPEVRKIVDDITLELKYVFANLVDQPDRPARGPIESVFRDYLLARDRKPLVAPPAKRAEAARIGAARSASARIALKQALTAPP